jgi:DtxR family Mn-dependent transcriptional regulator
MIDPLVALLAFALLLAVAAMVFWPEKGLLPRILRMSGLTERVRLEDSLKHLYKCELSGRVCSVDSLAGAAGVTRNRAVELLARLEELALAKAEGDSFVLTEEGREYALHIVRTHRLLERYFADRTGVRPQDWHREAERREHLMSPEDRESLAARLGHPVYDPHGDPIPTSAGDLPPRTGTPLTALDPGEAASIVHLGDEPREVYETLTRVGLTPSMPVRLLEVGPGEVRFEAAGRDLSLAPVIAAKITVELLPEADLAGLQGPQRRRLVDLGLVPGTLVESELESAGGDPVAYRIRGALIALRADQARWIQIDRQVEA